MSLTRPLPDVPMAAVLPELRAALAQHGRAVLTAPPGSGKTTRVPLALPGEENETGTVLVLEPRRLAARSAARYMARSLGEPVGGTVGYRVRLESRVSARTRVELITEGVLTRRLLADPELRGVSHVVFDEFHERSLQGDLGLALTLEAQRAFRPDLAILVMSATLGDETALADFLAPCPVIRAEGRLWPVDIRYEPPRGAGGHGIDPVPGVAEAVRRALREESGSLLVFLPGTGEIRRAAAKLADLPPHCRVHPLYGDLGPEAQDEAIAPAPPGIRKIVLATALAETSLTIEGVRVVVDAGLARTARFNPATGMDSLVTGRVSQAGADQRAGRAGRLEPGVCLRLWPRGEPLHAAIRPEMLEADLTPLLLQILAWGAQPDDLPWLTPPPAAALAYARQTLLALGAATVAAGGDRLLLSPHGRKLAEFPLHPRLAHMMLLAGDEAPLAAALAALIAERDPLRSAGADIRLRLACLSPHLRGAAEQILACLPGPGKKRLPAALPGEAAGRLLGLAWPERLAQRRSRGGFRLASGRGAELPPEDPLADEEFLAVASLDGGDGGESGRIFLAAPISREALLAEHGERIVREESVVWDERAEAVLARRRTRLDALILDDAPLAVADGNGSIARASVRAVLEGIRGLGLACLPWTDELRQWRARVSLLRDLEGEPWPDLGDAALLAALAGPGNWLEPYLNGVTRRAQFGRIDLAGALRALLPYALARRLEAEAPARITAPSGSSVALDYTAEGGPVLAVKLQEMFGQRATPRIAGGRCPLTIHLLSPAGRPLQITRDLEGFWKNGYPAVRAEMRGRYPRHPWPDDPLAAPPTKWTKKRTAPS